MKKDNLKKLAEFLQSLEKQGLSKARLTYQGKDVTYAKPEIEPGQEITQKIAPDEPAPKKSHRLLITFAIIGVLLLGGLAVLWYAGIIPGTPAPGETGQGQNQREGKTATTEKDLRLGEKVFLDDLAMLYIPGGESRIGFNEEGAEGVVVVLAKLDPFWIGKYEITFDQYDRYCEEAGQEKPADEGWGRGKRPAINVSWQDADGYCQWLSTKTGRTFTLPTEAQWEKAARGTQLSIYPWGNSAPDCGKANYKDCRNQTVPVGSYPGGVSFYGVHDMAGNVWEWVKDWYDKDYYKNCKYENPVGSAEGFQKTFRGGDWTRPAEEIKTTTRFYNSPNNKGNGIGFRVVMLEKKK
jgi:formylglycine-generating enzyme required for sulfatase activity